MNTSTLATDTILDKQSHELLWLPIYLLLLPLAKRWVYAAHIYSWYGQENDIAWDIVLVTIQRTYEYNLKAQSENIPVGSFQRLSISIAKNYFQDLRRKDSRLLPLNRDNCSHLEYTQHDEANVSEVILDKVYEEWLFQEIAKEIASYPTRMRTAMLIDIARRMEFNAQPTPLQAAFLKVGIQVRDYENLLPQDPIMRSRHSSLVSLGYKKLAIVFRSREFIEVVPLISNPKGELHEL
jgi:DNA-directed RNA polymerase specialized sigma24 family protein